jgi:hypothetical protein
MACPECPLAKLKVGDRVSGAYICGTTALLRPKLRVNCPVCPTGYVDFLGKEARSMGDNLLVGRVLSVQSCGKVRVN